MGAWNVSPRLDMSSLFPRSVMFALFDRDPVPAFLTRLRSRRSRRALEELRGEGDEARLGLLAALWDLGFRDLGGDQVYLLPSEAAPPSEKGKTVTLTRAFVMISSNEHAGIRWLATRAILHDDSALAWSLPIETVAGRTTSVLLDAANALDLSKLRETPRGA